jgi:hypothetical protein
VRSGTPSRALDAAAFERQWSTQCGAAPGARKSVSSRRPTGKPPSVLVLHEAHREVLHARWQRDAPEPHVEVQARACVSCVSELADDGARPGPDSLHLAQQLSTGCSHLLAPSSRVVSATPTGSRDCCHKGGRGRQQVKQCQATTHAVQGLLLAVLVVRQQLREAVEPRARDAAALPPDQRGPRDETAPSPTRR